ncbi:MAG: DNA modification methylase [Proteobacteria bacterium]|nr:DNA modification methylase [Pseudomonadota bacterium]MBU1640093.1 DNA modification methylase [Pseudomonadota bacterium]
MQTESWPIERLSVYERNPRKNNHAVDKMAEAITTYGFRVPILVTTAGQIIDGHLRLKGAIAAGLTSVPVVLVDDMADDKIKAFRLSINRMAELANWDEELLALEFADLKEMDFPLEFTGFDMDEIDKIMAALAGNDKDPDAAPPVPAVPTARPGDIWKLGGHRVMCGDSTNQGHWQQLMDGQLADMIWTDPPYNVAYESKAGTIQNDNLSSSDFRNFMRDVFNCLADIVIPGGAIYVAHADTERVNVQTAFEAAGFKLSSCLVWKKNQLVLGRADYHWQHEPILYGWKKGASHRWYGGRSRRTVNELQADSLKEISENTLEVNADNMVWQITGHDLHIESFCPSMVCFDKPSRNADHPTMKPVALVEYFLANSSRPGQIVADAFGGSGSTLMGCEVRNRLSRIMELEPKFVDVIITRWQDYTGGQATLAANNKTFAAIIEERGKDNG